MLRKWRSDLHIHTALSPCADLKMTPGAIVRQARTKGLDLIGICDHNSAENVLAVKRVGEQEGLTVVGGMEITSEEEVHVLALLDKDSDLQALQDIVYGHLDGVNDERVFGEQLLLDEDDTVLGYTPRLLIGSTTLLLGTIVEIVHSLDGLAIASHVDRESFSIISQLGFIPDGLPLDGLELSPLGSREAFKTEFPEAFTTFPLVAFSDAHYLDDVGKGSTWFSMEEATLKEMRKALTGEDGRSVSARPGHR